MTPLDDKVDGALSRGRSLLSKFRLGGGHSKKRGEWRVPSPSSKVYDGSSSVKSGNDRGSPSLSTRHERSTSAARSRPALKIRIITWNMHDEVPHGELSDLLGVLPHADTPLPQPDDNESLPSVSSGADGFYHVIVVGGQECPAGSKWSEILDHYLVQGHTAPAAEELRPLSRKEHFPTTSTSAAETKNHLMPPVSKDEDTAPAWRAESLPVKAHVGSVDHTTPLMRRKSSVNRSGKGPYVLVAKERLMEIYVAVFVLRSAEHLVAGHDKSTVTAGLLGGRVGNKGCAAVSLKIANTRLLFISAHLAAHQAGADNRRENVLKIKDELYIDDFSGQHKRHGGDSHHRRDITADFDCTFFFGDLNYRVDVSRLHADWLVQAHDWKTALAWDQLRRIMKDPQSVWANWQEADIDFAPTYKYDLIKDLHRLSSIKLRHRGDHHRWGSSMMSGGLSIGDLPPPVPSQVLEQPQISASPPSLVRRTTAAAGSVAGAGNSQVNVEDDGGQPIGHLHRSSSSSSMPITLGKGMRSDDTLDLHDRHRSTTADSADDDQAVYDTSKKQRVQSWCDRILWRCTMTIPDSEVADDDDDDDRKEGRQTPEKGESTRSQSPGQRAKKAVAGLSSPPVLQKLRMPDNSTVRPTSAPESDMPRAVSFLGVMQSSKDEPPSNGTTNLQSDSEEIDTTARMGRPRSRSDAGASWPRRASLWQTLTMSPTRLGDGPEVKRRSSAVEGGNSATWRGWWGNRGFSFLGTNTSPDPGKREESVPRPPPVQGPRRGEIEILQYTSVNDLRKMEALSDHRPVVGCYLLGIGGKAS